MNGIWIITEDKIRLCTGITMDESKLCCFSPDENLDFSFDCITPLAAKRIKREIDDTIMRGGKYYQLEV